MRKHVFWITAMAGICATMLSAGVAVAEDPSTPLGAGKVLFDFEDADSVNAWSNVDVYALRETAAKAAYDAAAKAAADPAKVAPYKPLVQPPKEPTVKIAWTTEGATRGKHAMKLTFAGGRYPTVGLKLPAEDWLRYNAFHADVTAERECMVIFRAIPEAANHGTSYNEGVSRWEFAARLSAGRNTLTAPRPDYAETRWKRISTFEIYMHEPNEGESIVVDNIYLSNERPASTSTFNERTQWPEAGFKVAGTDLIVRNADDLGDKLKLKETWVKPEAKTVEQVEAEVRAELEKIRKDHPRAVLVMLRQGQKGCDPANPDREFTGWECGYGYTHLPMGLAMTCSTNAGKVEQCEACLRGRPSYHRVDLSSIPEGAEILAARLIVVRSIPYTNPPWNNWETRPTLVVTEPCNRPWKEYEVTVFEYAKGRFWKDFASQSWGEDSDCGAVYLSYGPGSGNANSWDFTHAVRYWTEGKRPNHGFIISSPGKYLHALSIFTYRCRDLKSRPCVAVIYEPKP